MGAPGECALVGEGSVQARFDHPAAARAALLTSPLGHLLVVSLSAGGGWRHPRLVVDSYRRAGAEAAGTLFPTDPLARDIMVAESLRLDPTFAEAIDAPYMLLKDGAIIGRYKRVMAVRQAVDAAAPPLTPVVFASLRLGSLGPFSLMVIQGLVDPSSL